LLKFFVSAAELDTHPFTKMDIRKLNFLLVNTAFTVMAVLSGHFQGTFIHPCTPHLVGYFMLEECQLNTTTEIENDNNPPAYFHHYSNFIIKLVIVSINWFILSAYYFSINAELVCFSYLPCASFNRYLGIVGENMMKPTLNFERCFERNARIFRETRIMLIAYNDIHQSSAVVAALFQTVFVLSICFTALWICIPLCFPLNSCFL